MDKPGQIDYIFLLLFGWIRKQYLQVPILRHGLPVCGSAGKESTCNAGYLGLIPGLRRSPEEGKGYPLQYSGLENSMDCIVHGFAKSWTRLSDFHYTILRQHVRELGFIITFTPFTHIIIKYRRQKLVSIFFFKQGEIEELSKYNSMAESEWEVQFSDLRHLVSLGHVASLWA